MKSLLGIIPTKGIARVCPARGGHILGPLGILGMTIDAIYTSVGIFSGDVAPYQSLNLLSLASIAAVIYSVQCNPKGTPKSPLAL